MRNRGDFVIARKQRSPSLRGNRGLRHCEERSDEAIHMTVACPKRGLLRFARNDEIGAQ